MAPSPITSWQKDGKTMETEPDFIFLGSKITADGDYSHEIKRCLLLGRKIIINLESILKSKDITLPTKVHLVKAMVFSIVMYRCESWTIKKTEHRRIDAFELWCWRRLLRVPWTERRSKQSILKEISPEYSLEGLMLKLKLQYLGHLMQRADSLEKLSCWERLKAGGEGNNRGQGGWMASPTEWTWVWASSGRWWWTRKLGVLQSMGLQRVGHDWVNELTDSARVSQVALVVRNLSGNAGNIRDLDLVYRLGRSPGGVNGNPLQYSFLKNPMDRVSCQDRVLEISKSWTQVKQLSTHLLGCQYFLVYSLKGGKKESK